MNDVAGVTPPVEGQATTGARTRLGIGLVGVGWMGRLHSQSYQRVNYHFPELRLRPELVIAADLLPERGRLATDELGYGEWTDQWGAVVSHAEVDAVSITAPNYLHREIALAAAESGKHFWIEKPLGRNLEETTAIARAAQSAGVATAVGFNYRHAPAVQWARHLVRSGQLGRVSHVRGVFFNAYAADPRGARTWRFLRSLGGSGATGDLLSHTVDLLQHVVGPIGEVSALNATFVPERPDPPIGVATHFAVVEQGELLPVENEDYVGALLRFEDGAVGTCEASRATVGPQCQIAFDVYGSGGAVSWSFERMNELRVCIGMSGPHQGYTTVIAGPAHGDYSRFQPGPGIAMGYDDLKVVEAELFLRSIESGSQVGAGVADACLTAEVLAAIGRAAVSDRWESVRGVGQPLLPQPGLGP